VSGARNRIGFSSSQYNHIILFDLFDIINWEFLARLGCELIMGTLSFLIPEQIPDRARQSLINCHLIETIEFFPVPTQTVLDHTTISVTREENESGCVGWSWPVDQANAVVVRSATLRERGEPYVLFVELIRGKFNQLRNQVADWERIGFRLEPEDRKELNAIVKMFSQLVTIGDSGPAFDQTHAVMIRIFHLINRLTRQYADQLLYTRVSEMGQLPTKLSIRVEDRPSAERFASLHRQFSAIRIVPNWRAIEPKESEYHWNEMDDVLDWACQQ
jgi:hypothetical protein